MEVLAATRRNAHTIGSGGTHVEKRLMFVGAIGAFFLAVGATLVSDMHGVGDWMISSMQVRNLPLSPSSIYSAPYSIAGFIGEPLLIVSIAMFTTGFFGTWLKYRKAISLALVVVGGLYLLERVFWSYVTLNFSRALQALPVIQDYAVLTTAGFLKGMGALLGGILGGFTFSTLITVFFFKVGNPYGKAGGLVVLLSMLIGMPAKLLFMNNVSFLLVAVFMTSMVVKNFGIVFMGIGLLRESQYEESRELRNAGNAS
jgi:hypothetical protein